jgi:hypothetical protein
MSALWAWAEEIEEPVRKARQNVEDWHKRWGGMFSGSIRTASVGGVGMGTGERIVGDANLERRLRRPSDE